MSSTRTASYPRSTNSSRALFMIASRVASLLSPPTRLTILDICLVGRPPRNRGRHPEEREGLLPGLRGAVRKIIPKLPECGLAGLRALQVGNHAGHMSEPVDTRVMALYSGPTFFVQGMVFDGLNTYHRASMQIRLRFVPGQPRRESRTHQCIERAVPDGSDRGVPAGPAVSRTFVRFRLSTCPGSTNNSGRFGATRYSRPRGSSSRSTGSTTRRWTTSSPPRG